MVDDSMFIVNDLNLADHGLTIVQRYFEAMLKQSNTYYEGVELSTERKYNFLFSFCR